MTLCHRGFMGRTLPLLHSVLVIKAKEWAFRSCIENGNDEYLSLNAIALRLSIVSRI
jgi:hypothetical protein